MEKTSGERAQAFWWKKQKTFLVRLVNVCFYKKKKIRHPTDLQQVKVNQFSASAVPKLTSALVLLFLFLKWGSQPSYLSLGRDWKGKVCVQIHKWPFLLSLNCVFSVPHLAIPVSNPVFQFISVAIVWFLLWRHIYFMKYICTDLKRGCYMIDHR